MTRSHYFFLSLVPDADPVEGWNKWVWLQQKNLRFLALFFTYKRKNEITLFFNCKRYNNIRRDNITFQRYFSPINVLMNYDEITLFFSVATFGVLLSSWRRADSTSFDGFARKLVETNLPQTRSLRKQFKVNKCRIMNYLLGRTLISMNIEKFSMYRKEALFTRMNFVFCIS